LNGSGRLPAEPSVADRLTLQRLGHQTTAWTRFALWTRYWRPPTALLRGNENALPRAAPYGAQRSAVRRGDGAHPRRNKPGVEEVAYVDPRDDTERARYESLRSHVISELETAGLAEIAPAVDGNLFIATFDPRVPDRTRQRMVEMADLGLPFAVFVGPPEAAE
jgi:hypothetical protein